MGTKLKRAFGAITDAAVAYNEYNHEVNTMANELIRRNRNIDVETARSIAKTLVNQAEVTWK